MWSLPSLKQTVRPLKTWDTSKGKMNSSSFQPSTYRCFHSPVGFQGGSFLSHFDPEFWVIFSGSTIRTLLHRKINPKDWQASSLWWCFGFLLFFRVVSGDYGKPANPVFEPTQNPTNPDPRFQRRVCCIAWDLPRHGEHCEKQSDTVDDVIDLCAISLCISCSAISGSEFFFFNFFLLDWREMMTMTISGGACGWLVAPMTYKEVVCKNHFQRILPISNWREIQSSEVSVQYERDL